KAGTAALPPVAELGPIASARVEAFLDAVAGDLALPRALAELWGLLRDSAIPPAEALAGAFDMDRILALGLAELEKPKEASVDPALAARVEALIAERSVAKKAKDFVRADAIRAEITSLGVVLADNPSGSTWKLAPKDSANAPTP
ncbi:MAG: hypothetical protein WCQ50_21495, partial [Spirochaetota bacterium]